MNHPTSLLIDSHGRILRDLRSDASDEAIQEYLESVVLQKEDRHHIGSPREIPNGVEEANQPSRFIASASRSLSSRNGAWVALEAE